MNINFNYNNNTEAQALTTITEQKLSTLKKFIAAEAPVICDAEFDKVAANQNGQVFRFAVNLQVDGKLYRADATEESFEKAVDEVRAELDKEMRRSAKKHDSLLRRGGRAIKAMMRGEK